MESKLYTFSEEFLGKLKKKKKDPSCFTSLSLFIWLNASHPEKDSVNEVVSRLPTVSASGSNLLVLT